MKWQKSDERKSQSGWVNKSEHKKLQNRSGVYIFTRGDGHVQYIGMSVHVRKRVKQQLSDKGIGSTRVLAMYTSSESAASSLEGKLIKKYQPPKNTHKK